ncbi:hypothetical protein ACP4OV_005976 [Aristida adscensionis]
MASKALFLLALLASAAVLATAADQAATHDNKEKARTNDAGVNGYRGGGGGGCKYGCCRHGYHGGCQQCCRSPDEVPQQQVKN